MTSVHGTELGRVAMPDGTTHVTVALGVDRQGVIVVPSDLVDAPGYQDMLDAYATKQAGLERLRNGGVPL